MSSPDTPVSYPETTGQMSADTSEAALVEKELGGMVPAVPGTFPKVDGRARLARVFRTTRNQMVDSLGGKENLSPQKAIAIRLLSEAEALRSGIFAAATRGEAIDSEDHARFAKATIQCLKLLGMERYEKAVKRLSERVVQDGGGTSQP